MTIKTVAFRQHHTEVRDLIARIEKQLDASRIEADPAPVGSLVRELFGKFGVHLSIEDATLYPRMLAHTDTRVRQAAQQFQQEMGNLKVRFDTYRQKWPGPLAIGRAPKDFVAETGEIITALKQRIGREDTQLYDLYDRVA